MSKEEVLDFRPLAFEGTSGQHVPSPVREGTEVVHFFTSSFSTSGIVCRVSARIEQSGLGPVPVMYGVMSHFRFCSCSGLGFSCSTGSSIFSFSLL